MVNVLLLWFHMLRPRYCHRKWIRLNLSWLIGRLIRLLLTAYSLCFRKLFYLIKDIIGSDIENFNVRAPCTNHHYPLGMHFLRAISAYLFFLCETFVVWELAMINYYYYYEFPSTIPISMESTGLCFAQWTVTLLFCSAIKNGKEIILLIEDVKPSTIDHFSMKTIISQCIHI